MKKAEQYPYLRKSLLGPWWKEANNECTIESVEEFELSMSKPAPPLRDQPPPPKAPPQPKRPPKPLIDGLLEAAIKFQEWKNSPPVSNPAPIPAPSPVKKPRVKPFDLQDIPNAMERIGWTMSARVQRKWFAGELNYANSDEGAIKGINQDGKPFPKSMIDTTMFTLDWILKFTRAKEKFDELISEKLFNQDAYKSLQQKFSRWKPSPYCVNAWKISGEDIHEHHRQFQYQRNAVDSDFFSKLMMFAKGSTKPNGIWMDDLYGALGGFSFYAAIDSFSYFRPRPGLTRLSIDGVSIYMRDAFTFHDRSAERGSQYLGHWNKTGFIIVPAAAAIGEISKSDSLVNPVSPGGTVSDDTVYYPVKNNDYRNWQMRHKQGGDLIFYSNRWRVPLRESVVMEFNQ